MLLPLVEAIEFCCQQHETVRASIASVINTITFVMTPGEALVATLNLHQSIGEPVVAPSALGTPPIKNGVLVYNGCFEAGHKGCFTKSNIVEIMEVSWIDVRKRGVRRKKGACVGVCGWWCYVVPRGGGRVGTRHGGSTRIDTTRDVHLAA